MIKNEMKFSLWLDFIQRDFLDKEFVDLIDNHIIRGATSNPTIFKNAIFSSPSYKSQIVKQKNKNAKDIYEDIAVYDIKKAAKLLRPIYDNDKNDGYVSIEVDPNFCFDAKNTIDEGLRLSKAINENNVMIKIPATKQGYEAIRELTSLGIPVNVTLVFSEQEAMLALEAIRDGTSNLDNKPFCVISIFVSRIDRVLDDKLEQLGIEKTKAGLLNASNIYNLIENENMSNVKTLFASTGVKADKPESSYYIKELLFSNSINTAPLETINTFIKQENKIVVKKPENSKDFFEKLRKNGIDFNQILKELKDDGLDIFKASFDEILSEIDKIKAG
jgi:transaldolase